MRPALRRRRTTLVLLAVAALGAACDERDYQVIGAATQSARRGGFVDVSSEAGIDVVGVCGESQTSKRWILEVNGSGAALFDMDGDGDLDLWLTNGSTLDSLRDGKPGAGNTLWRNDGHGRFSAATENAGIGGSRWGNGVAVGDVDNDGDLDVFVAEFGPDLLYLNDGKGRFREVGASSGLTDPRWSSSATFVDYDRDGDLDLFVGNYLKFDLQHPPAFGGDSQWRGHPVMRGPRGLPMDRPSLYRNDGVGADGAPRFRDVTLESGIAKAKEAFPLGVLALDFDDDGDDDLFVSNDSQPNQLFENLGNGTFREIGSLAGCDVDDHGSVNSGMGTCAGDYDGDGRLDIAVMNFSAQTKNVFHNEGKFFVDRSYPSGVGGASLPMLGWGCRFLDADLDGCLDLFTTNGHVYPEADLPGTDTSYAQTNQCFRGDGRGKFENAGAGWGLVEKRVHRGAAFGDIDGDGDEDAIVTVMNGKPIVLRNDVADAGRSWIAFELQGTRSSRSPWGARVRVRVGDRWRVSMLQPGSSFQSSNEPCVRFGLGDADRVDEVEIRWPSGRVDRAASLPSRQVHRFVESTEGTATQTKPKDPR